MTLFYTENDHYYEVIREWSQTNKVVLNWSRPRIRLIQFWVPDAKMIDKAIISDDVSIASLLDVSISTRMVIHRDYQFDLPREELRHGEFHHDFRAGHRHNWEQPIRRLDELPSDLYLDYQLLRSSHPKLEPLR